MKRSSFTSLHYLLFVVIAAMATACASIGKPEGGPRDEKPPVFVNANPRPGSLNVKRNRIDLYFDENVQLEDAFNRVVVSPAQKNTPSVSANGRHVSVELRDTLLPNTTYTVDFADAIKDLNEGNILDGFAIDFSTGDSIDSLRISGMVVEARTLEPAQGMLVGVYSNLADSAVRTLPLERIARTNQLGQFTIRNLKPGEYRIFAINDVNRDLHWDRSEDIAFYDTTISPYATTITVTDTLRAADGGDSLASRQGTAFYPNDVLLSWFNEGFKTQYIKDYNRPERRKIVVNMAAPADSLPSITIAQGPLAGRSVASWARMHKNPTLDSLEYWITDPDVLATDSLYLAMRYRRTDSLSQLSWATDTLKFFFREPKSKKKKKDEAADTLPPKPDFTTFSPITSATHDVYMPLIFSSLAPIDTILSDGVHLEIQNDTLWDPVAGAKFEIDSVYPLMRRQLSHQWEPGAKYRLVVDSAAVRDVYGGINNSIKHEFTVKNLEEYANLTFTVTGLDSLPAYVELLDKQEKVLRIAKVTDGSAVFRYLAPGVVYARLYIDANSNGQWDTGNIADTLQPEEVYYYPKKINLRKNWDVTQPWAIYELPVDVQKPYDIKKNKPKLKKGEKAPVDEDLDEEDEFGGYNNRNRNNNSRRQNNNRTPQGNRGGMGGMGGFQMNNLGGLRR